MSGECKGCGAEIEYVAGSQSLKCPYCDAVNEILKPEDQLPDGVDLIIPLAVTRDDLEKHAYAFMAGGDYTPDNMLEASTFIRRDCFYVPAYQFQVSYEATWTASFGYDRQESYTAFRTVTRNGRSHQEAYTAYRTLTDWRPANGMDSGVLTVSAYAGGELHDSDLSPAELVSSIIESTKSTSFNLSFMKEVEAESFSVPKAKALTSLSEKINAKIDHKVQSHGQGDHQKDWHWNATMNHTASTLYVPLCHAVFDYLGTNYHYWIDGAGNATFRADKLPEDTNKKKLVKLGFIPFTVAGVGLALTAAMWTITPTGLVATAVVAVFAAMRRNAIVKYSKDIRKSLLTQIQSSSSTMTGLSLEEKEKIARAFQRPDKPVFAKTHLDKYVLPALTVVALLCVVIPAYLDNPHRLRGESPRQTMAVETSALRVTPAATRSNNGAKSSQASRSKPDAEESSEDSPATASQEMLTADLSASAANCENVNACIKIMQQAVQPRKPEVISIAVKRISGGNHAQAGDRKASQALNQKAIDEFKKHDLDGAIKLLEQAAAGNPVDVDVSENLGFLYLQANRLEEAGNSLRNALQLEPRRASMWGTMAELYAVNGDADAALRSLLLAYEFSANKEQTLASYEDKATTAESEAMRSVFDAAVQAINDVDFDSP